MLQRVRSGSHDEERRVTSRHLNGDDDDSSVASTGSRVSSPRPVSIQVGTDFLSQSAVPNIMYTSLISQRQQYRFHAVALYRATVSSRYAIHRDKTAVVLWKFVLDYGFYT